MNIELKPCPFCGGEAYLRDFGAGFHKVCCWNRACAMTCETPMRTSAEKAITDWNTRAEPRTCETCYYYQTVYDRNRPTERRACFGEHLRVAVGGLDWDEEAEAWAEMDPTDVCSKWTPRD